MSVSDCDYEVYAGKGPLSRLSIYRCSDENPQCEAIELASLIVSGLDETAIRKFAIFYVASVIDSYRRAAARVVEERAEIQALKLRLADQRKREWGEAEKKERKDWEEFRDNPDTYWHPSPWKEGYQRLTRREERNRFRVWMGDDFEGWYEQTRRRVSEKGSREQLEYFEADWDPRGSMAYVREKALDAVFSLIDKLSREIRLEVTSELLETRFALGDGSETTWGAATREQHQQRLEMLAKHASGTVETAARHEAAIHMLEESGVRCLRELVEQPVTV